MLRTNRVKLAKFPGNAIERFLSYVFKLLDNLQW